MRSLFLTVTLVAGIGTTATVADELTTAPNPIYDVVRCISRSSYNLPPLCNVMMKTYDVAYCRQSRDKTIQIVAAQGAAANVTVVCTQEPTRTMEIIN
jgi:hypothetical protein